MIEIRPIQAHEINEAKRVIFTVAFELFKGADTLEESIAKFSAQGKLAEMSNVQKNYFDNKGTFLVTVDDGSIIGTGAIRFLEEDVCELKRMWLLTEYHGHGLGYRMMQELFGIARTKGYKIMRLETDPVFQQRAVEFYKRLGFYEIPRYGDDPDDMGMELIL
ncbi:MAG TPA: GNAT family N-acetyltransferase [Anaerolineales bacterium]|nr:GNAT family N-acetyltransferase [Anaerolineales bacterium]